MSNKEMKLMNQEITKSLIKNPRKESLSKEDFLKLNLVKGCKSQLFSDRLYSIFDTNSDGTVTVEEFRSWIEGIKTFKDKMALLFKIYDTRDTGYLDLSEIRTVISEMADDLNLDSDDVRDLTRVLFEEAVEATRNVEQQTDIDKVSFDGFLALLHNDPDLKTSISTTVDRWLSLDRGDVSLEVEKESFRLQNKADAWIQSIKHEFVLYAFQSLYFFIIAVHMSIAGFKYKDFKNRDGSRNWFVITARVFGFPLNFLCTVILIFMMRRFLNHLRELGLHTVLPLDHHKHFHMTTGILITIFGSIHTIAHLLNLKFNVVPNAVRFMQINGLDDPIQLKRKYSFYEWIFTSTPGLFGLIPGYANITGVLMLIIVLTMTITSIDVIRRSGYFNLFYFFHLLYIPFFGLTILHAPRFWTYFGIPGAYFAASRFFFGNQRGRDESWVGTALLLPQRVTCLIIKKPIGFTHQSGDWVFIRSPKIAQYEWHPFTISSAPENRNVFTLHVRTYGSWTRSLRKHFEREYERLSAKRDDGDMAGRLCDYVDMSNNVHRFSVRCKGVSYLPPAAHIDKSFSTKDSTNDGVFRLENPLIVEIDGPYHAPTTNIFQTEHAVLIATGIGVTPFASILQSILTRHLNSTKTCPSCQTSFPAMYPDDFCGNLKSVEFIWVVPDPSAIKWFVDVLAGLEIMQESSGNSEFLQIRIFVTKPTSNMITIGLKMAMNLLHRKENRDALSGLKTKTEAGRPDWDMIFMDIENRKKGKISVFYCGVPELADDLRRKCLHKNFNFHRETF